MNSMDYIIPWGGVKLKIKVTYAVGQTKSAVFKNGQFSKMRNTVGKTKK